MDKAVEYKNELKRLLIFLAFAFVITWIVFFVFIFFGNTFNVEDGNEAMAQLMCLGMLCPTLAMILTRYVTKEGFAVTGKDSMLLGISFKDRKWIYYVIAILLPWIYYELGNGLFLLVSGAFDINAPYLLGVEKGEEGILYMQPIIMIVSATLSSFAAFGEEAGWRGYMMPKMTKLFGVKKAILVGGIIWGMWHFPLTYVGHNFGMDYWGYPFTGFGAMCILCIFIGIILAYITYKSGSIWPATILHAVNNASPSILKFYINEDKFKGWSADSVVHFLIVYIPLIIISIFVFVKFNKELKRTVTVLS